MSTDISTDIFVVDRRDLRQRRIVWAFWFALIWFVFIFSVATGAAAQIHVLVLVAATLAFYFVPTIVALKRGHHQWLAIVVLNVALGWTVLGWLAALVWSCTAVRD